MIWVKHGVLIAKVGGENNMDKAVCFWMLALDNMIFPNWHLKNKSSPAT